MYKHIISTDTGEQRLQKNKICSKRNTAHGHAIQKQ